MWSKSRGSSSFIVDKLIKFNFSSYGKIQELCAKVEPFITGIQKCLKSKFPIKTLSQSVAKPFLIFILELLSKIFLYSRFPRKISIFFDFKNNT